MVSCFLNIEKNRIVITFPSDIQMCAFRKINHFTEILLLIHFSSGCISEFSIYTISVLPTFSLTYCHHGHTVIYIRPISFNFYVTKLWIVFSCHGPPDWRSSKLSMLRWSNCAITGEDLSFGTKEQRQN